VQIDALIHSVLSPVTTSRPIWSWEGVFCFETDGVMVNASAMEAVDAKRAVKRATAEVFILSFLRIGVFFDVDYTALV
jgi:hypothetical protein